MIKILTKLGIILSSLLITFICLNMYFQQFQKNDLVNQKNNSQSLQHQLKSNNQFKNINSKSICNTIHLDDYEGIVKSGFLDVGIKNSNSSLGFIFYGAKGRKEEDIFEIPIILWLNGGPGCSSQYGNFFEVGPLRLEISSNLSNHPFLTKTQKTFKFNENKYSWSNDYNIIFIDQPIGTGISYAQKDEEIPTNQDEIAEQFYYALNEFYSQNLGCFLSRNMEKQNEYPPLFIFGESYAGKYIPSISQKIFQQGNKFNLMSIGIGDAFIAPEIILKEIPQYAYEHNLLNKEQLAQSMKAVQEVLDSVSDPQRIQISRSLYWKFIQTTNPNKVDVYNISRQEGEQDNGSKLEAFLNDEQNGLRNFFDLKMQPNSLKQYKKCDQRVQKAMSLDFMRGDCLSRLDYLLSQGLEVVIYNGDLDMIVPKSAPVQWIQTLQDWKFTKEFLQQETQPWQIDSQIYGTLKQFKNLSLYVIKQSGHMVPEDQSVAALHLINKTVKRALEKKKIKHLSKIFNLR